MSPSRASVIETMIRNIKESKESKSNRSNFVKLDIFIEIQTHSPLVLFFGSYCTFPFESTLSSRQTRGVTLS